MVVVVVVCLSHDSEELISNIVRLASGRPDGGLPDVSARKAVVVVIVVVLMVVVVVVVMVVVMVVVVVVVVVVCLCERGAHQ